MNKLQLCRVCQSVETPIVFNINFKAVPVCNACAKSIFLQEAEWLARAEAPHDFKERKITTANKHGGATWTRQN